ncbi:MAG: type II toxin-antitoxin system VapC family toxin [Egibacteraceae bacterium]
MRVLDTSVAVDHLRGHQPATQLLDALLDSQVTLVTSEVVRFELLAGARPANEQALETFLEVLDWVPVTEAVARRAVAFARGFRGSHSGIDTADYLVAATATVLDAPLLTTNVRHFPMFDGLARPY